MIAILTALSLWSSVPTAPPAFTVTGPSVAEYQISWPYYTTVATGFRVWLDGRSISTIPVYVGKQKYMVGIWMTCNKTGIVHVIALQAYNSSGYGPFRTTSVPFTAKC